VAQITDERVLLNELELLLGGRVLEQSLQFAQAPDAMRQGQLAGVFQVGGRLFGGQVQKALQYPDAFDPALFEHPFGPGTGMRAEQPGPIQQPLRPVFDDRTFATVEMRRIGAELARLPARVQGNLLHAGVENPHQPQLPPRPDFPPDIFRWHRVIRARHFHMAIPVNGARGFAKNREQGRRQRPQRGLLVQLKNLRHLLARGAVDDAQTSDGRRHRQALLPINLRMQ